MFGDRGEFLKIKSYARYNPIQTSESLSQKCVQAILPHTHRSANQIQRAMAQSGRIPSRHAYTNQSYTAQVGDYSSRKWGWSYIKVNHETHKSGRQFRSDLFYMAS